ncbi:MAG: hypothetical protein COU11_04570 [Candidatus Harrisonbacteria bacterium CG10_big_fil_rev_8_21_14_0_10_49_15]|uniref:Uncharacterized protein n=1 Tax=Candidatus Harrisonbacteria bacterium CG10_big_fil_rev_8_21_14_0_10_49_15 TaxID=1974587 RepID=A0A2H0UK20_9BACT|nr:MAG: hypothetical protein COU11_04570 [Candidatus Harrisonbacteria bacterium CG10_big_fil_rev_8_21_14_0_10_49_15]
MEATALRTCLIGQPGRDHWQVTVLDELRPITPAMVEHGRRLIEEWANVFPLEETWVQREAGLPSLIVRLDCVPDWERNELQICEIDDRPQGFGVGGEINYRFRERFAEVRASWPRVTVVSCPHRRGGDDYLWTDECRLAELPADSKTLVVTRCEPTQTEFWPLAGRAIAPVRTEGDKSYGERLGWWRTVTRPEDLPGLGQGFCLKPTQGSKCQNILIVHPECGPGASGNKKRRADGTKVSGYSRNQAEAHLRRHGKLFCQPFIAPVIAELADRGKHNLLYRISYAFCLATRQWVCLGGTWFARPYPQLLLHGASDAIVGPVVIGD